MLLAVAGCGGSTADKGSSTISPGLPANTAATQQQTAKWPASRCDIISQADVEAALGMPVTSVEDTPSGCAYINDSDAVDFEYYSDDGEYQILQGNSDTTPASGFGKSAYYSNVAGLGAILFVVLADGRSFYVGSTGADVLETLAAEVIAGA